ncbi:hypothetical protein GLOIN_2v1768935 [Rhizophagus irregularis DAOM 181602=DAOM 197198]|uniref:Uncharacterized protein n=1 Tax=Rhizophagus irregularis (strain DAOM 181602 / DAOM 197198 / MUCL 43194) TaxID=747089 RepID=A0A2P4QFX8_RHIID|nr:hypothetical protein GLOIN_2v1768935 [Rhizophagus irregularis DAOM 181602=DAOM 197198]POG76542.1 hypothetical protein GLOIN_2v1768935 [Rhizophagus irregularis DAOM 181602=DAOM 197198]|eukprot:XP_025183408.1 hypothetical protein GLOIN_2v1768935 [Rhizophagus irregularis DAOM 181602=DAOM 197198]
MVKKKYKIGTCFGCQKCLYCGIDLEKDISFDPITSNPKQFDFVKNKNEHFQYGYDLTKSIQFSLCTKSETTEVIDLETGSSEVSTVTQSKSKHNDSENDDDDELEMEIDYKLVIKQADGSALPAKNYSVTISELDEFLLAIQNNITALLKDDEINANDYNISFKSEKAQGAAKRTMLILVTMKKKEKLVKRKKKESNSDDDEIICDESIPKGGNSNKIPKVSDISIIDQRIAKNVIELRKETWCSIHNSLATVKEPPTHLSFGYTHPSKNRSQSNLPQFSNNVQDLINPIFSTLLQALVTPHFLQQPSSSLTSNNSIVSQSSQSIPSMAEFL